jgi:hypothetical protein
LATWVRQRQRPELDPWLERAATSTLEALRRFAKGLYEDFDAVKAGGTFPWSTVPVEGHINRLKRLKRQMFGRARVDLLSRRSVRASVWAGPCPINESGRLVTDVEIGMARHHALRPRGALQVDEARHWEAIA